MAAKVFRRIELKEKSPGEILRGSQSIKKYYYC